MNTKFHLVEINDNDNEGIKAAIIPVASANRVENEIGYLLQTDQIIKTGSLDEMNKLADSMGLEHHHSILGSSYFSCNPLKTANFMDDPEPIDPDESGFDREDDEF